jgi:hypothetical protein
MLYLSSLRKNGEEGGSMGNIHVAQKQYWWSMNSHTAGWSYGTYKAEREGKAVGAQGQAIRRNYFKRKIFTEDITSKRRLCKE